MDGRGDYNSSPCLSYRPAKNKYQYFTIEKKKVLSVAMLNLLPWKYFNSYQESQ